MPDGQMIAISERLSAPHRPTVDLKEAAATIESLSAPFSAYEWVIGGRRVGRSIEYIFDMYGSELKGGLYRSEIPTDEPWPANELINGNRRNFCDVLDVLKVEWLCRVEYTAALDSDKPFTDSAAALLKRWRCEANALAGQAAKAKSHRKTVLLDHCQMIRGCVRELDRLVAPVPADEQVAA